MNSYDKKLCEAMAELWIEMGGDSDGFLYCFSYILFFLRVDENNMKETT